MRVAKAQKRAKLLEQNVTLSLICDKYSAAKTRTAHQGGGGRNFTLNADGTLSPTFVLHIRA